MAITHSEILKAIQEGTIEANTRYETWTKGYWVTDSGVEGLMVATIAEALHERFCEHDTVVLELSFQEIEEWSRAPPRPGVRPAVMKKTSRADIVLLNGRARPTCIIEVKRMWEKTSCLNDLARIGAHVRRLSHSKGGSVRRGFLAFLIAGSDTEGQSPRACIEARAEEIVGIVDSDLRYIREYWRWWLGESISLGEPYEAEYGKWEAASFSIEIPDYVPSSARARTRWPVAVGRSLKRA